MKKTRKQRTENGLEPRDFQSASGEPKKTVTEIVKNYTWGLTTWY